jgi:hypothetical protein
VAQARPPTKPDSSALIEDINLWERHTAPLLWTSVPQTDVLQWGQGWNPREVAVREVNKTKQKEIFYFLVLLCFELATDYKGSTRQ